MNMPLGQTKRPDLSAEQQTANDLITVIRKLRWMHMEDEAGQVQMQLASCRAAPTDTVLSEPPDTD